MEPKERAYKLTELLCRSLDEARSLLREAADRREIIILYGVVQDLEGAKRQLHAYQAARARTD